MTGLILESRVDAGAENAPNRFVRDRVASLQIQNGVDGALHLRIDLFVVSYTHSLCFVFDTESLRVFLVYWRVCPISLQTGGGGRGGRGGGGSVYTCVEEREK